METQTLKGTTTIGVVCKDGVIFAADKRASWGTFIASKRARKIYKINEYVAATVAGSVGDAETLMRIIKAEAALYEMISREVMTPNAVATLLANILQGSKVFPYLVQLLVGGIEKGKPKIYSLDPIGGITDEEIAASGSGSPMAYGILDQFYSKEKEIDENLPIVLKALNAAMNRDSATGDGIALAIITKHGFKEFSEKEIESILKKE